MNWKVYAKNRVLKVNFYLYLVQWIYQLLGPTFLLILHMVWRIEKNKNKKWPKKQEYLHWMRIKTKGV